MLHSNVLFLDAMFVKELFLAPQSLKLFKASALWADAFYKSKCPSVCVSVCSLLRYRLNVFLPPLPEVGCPIFLEIQNSWGKVVKRSGLRFEHWKWFKIAKLFFCWLILPYKTW